MSLTSLINRPCTIVRRSPSGSEDDYGNDISEETSEETVCEIQQRQRDEPGNLGELSDTAWVGFFLLDTELHTDDALLVDGIGEFELVGDPWAVRNPRTRLESHVEATLRRTKGAESGS